MGKKDETSAEEQEADYVRRAREALEKTAADIAAAEAKRAEQENQ